MLIDPEKKTPLYQRLAPWVGAVTILILLFLRVDMNQFLAALQGANLYVYIPLAFGFILFWFLVDSRILFTLFSHFGHGMPFSEVLRLRGATYSLMIVNYSLGVGGMAFYLKQIKGLPLMRISSLLMFYEFAGNISLCLIAAIGCQLSGETSAILNRIFLLCVSILTVNILMIVIYRALPEAGLFGKIKGSQLFKAFDEAELRSYIMLPAMRGIYFASFIVFFYFAVKAFHMDIPMLTLAGLIPVIFYIASIPITPFGLGTLQAAMIFFFQDYSSEANILALSITYSTSVLLMRALIGVLCLHKLVPVQKNASVEDVPQGVT